MMCIIILAHKCRVSYILSRDGGPKPGAGTMRVSREQAAENRSRVVEVAGRLFRERGFDGIGVADLMKAAGLTHGGFYGQFSSKDQLAVEATERALEGNAVIWRRRASGAEGRSEEHTSELQSLM